MFEKIKGFDPARMKSQLNLEDKTYTDFHSRNTIIFGSLLESGFDWGRNDWSAYNISEEAMIALRPRINEKVEDRFFFRELGMLPPGAFKKHLKSRLSEAVAKHGVLYQKIFDGLDFADVNFEEMKYRQINSEYPQAQLMPKQEDYASNAIEHAYDKKLNEKRFATFQNFYQSIEEPDGQVLKDIELCFSQLLSFNHQEKIMINHLQPWYGGGSRTPILPGSYTTYYTQEDRLKSLAEIIERQSQWMELLLEKVNELTDEVNELKGE